MQNLIPFQYTHRAQFWTVFFRGDEALFSYQNFHCGCMAIGFLGLPMVLAFTSLKFKTSRQIARLFLLTSLQQPLPNLLDIPKFLCSKWLAIIDLHCTGEAGFDKFIPKKKKKQPHNLAVLSSSFMRWFDNVNWNSCVFLDVTSVVTTTTRFGKGSYSIWCDEWACFTSFNTYSL